MKKNSTNYFNDAHQWMDKHVLNGCAPILDGVLLLPGHGIPASQIWTQLKNWTEEYLNAGTNRTELFHSLIDREIALNIELDRESGYPPAVCAKGCANCCYQPVTCTDEEAELIHSYCNENAITIDYDRLRRQQSNLSFDEEDNFSGESTWNDQPEEDQRCIFLNANDNSCMIWPVRPFVCRTQLAEETNRYCKSHNSVPDANAKGILYLECSYITSAVFTIHRASIGKMMNALLMNLKNDER